MRHHRLPRRRPTRRRRPPAAASPAHPSGYLGGLPNTTNPSQITLQPGEEATALLEGLNGNPTGPDCASSPAILVTLPDNTDSITLTTTTQVCQDLQIHPLIAGDTGTRIS